jgi:hypothetical protein
MSETKPDRIEKSRWKQEFAPRRVYQILPSKKGDWIPFALLSDTHFVSNYAREDLVKRFYADMQKEGIRDFFHCGDLWDGCTGYTQIYPGHIHNVPFLGFDKALNYVVDNYPKAKNAKTHLILGNHEARVLEREGLDFGKHLAGRRPDIDYLQPYYARVQLSIDPPIFLDMVHPAWHIPYTVGYLQQKYLRLVPPSQRANIYGFGHTHHHQHVSIEGDDESFLTGGWQDSNEFTIRRGMGSELGGYLLRVRPSTNSPNPIERLESTWLNYE